MVKPTLGDPGLFSRHTKQPSSIVDRFITSHRVEVSLSSTRSSGCVRRFSAQSGYITERTRLHYSSIRGRQRRKAAAGMQHRRGADSCLLPIQSNSRRTAPVSSPPWPGSTVLQDQRIYDSPMEQTILTPDQFSLPTSKSLGGTGERRLLLAVLKEAVHTYHRYCQAHTRREQRLFGEVQEWIWARDTDHLYAFESICSYLDLDPDFIRTGLPRGYAQPTSSTFPVGTRRKEQPLPAEATSFAWVV